MERYRVGIKKRMLRRLERLPVQVQRLFEDLLRDLATHGPLQPQWPNYGKLGEGTYHCHLNYGHVACWTYEKRTILIEVYYVGSRENAPY